MLSLIRLWITALIWLVKLFTYVQNPYFSNTSIIFCILWEIVIIVDDRILFTPPTTPLQCRTKLSDQVERVDRYKAYTIHRWPHVVYERTHSSVVYEQYICCFWESLTMKFENFIFQLGRKEISIVHVTHYFQVAERSPLAMKPWWYELEVELAGCLIYSNRESR